MEKSRLLLQFCTGYWLVIIRFNMMYGYIAFVMLLCTGYWLVKVGNNIVQFDVV